MSVRTRIGTFLLFVLMAGYYPASSRSNVPEKEQGSVADVLHRKIDSVYQTIYYDDFEGALAELRQVRKQAAHGELPEVELSALLNMHYCAQYHGEVDTMAHYLEEARDFFMELPRKVPDRTRDRLERKLRYAYGNAAYRYGEYEQAINEFERIIAFDSLQPVYLYKCLSFIGHAYSNLDHYSRAIDYHTQAMKKLPEVKKYHYYRGVSYSYLGIAYKKMYESKLDTTLLRSALTHYQQSLAYFDQSGNKNKRGPIGCLTLLSEAYGVLGKPDSSSYFLQKAQVIDPGHAETHRFWGLHYNREGNYEKARKSFLRSNEIIAAKQGAGHFLIGRNLMLAGRQYEAEQRWEEALQTYQQAFGYLTSGTAPLSDLFTNPDAKDAVSDRDFFECMRLKAGALLAWARVDSLSQDQYAKRLSSSIRTYSQLVDLIDEQRIKYASSQYRQLIGAKALAIYEEAISACYDAVQNGLDPKQYTDLAFFFAEKNKNRQLRDALRINRNIRFAGIPRSLLEQEKDLKGKLSYTNRLLIQAKQKTGTGRDEQKIQSLQSDLFDLKKEWQQFEEQLAVEYPAYHQLKAGEPIMNTEELQAKLGDRKLLLEYFYGDQEAFVFAITDQGVVFERLPAVSTIDQLLSKTLKAVRKPASGQLPSEALLADLQTLKDMLMPSQINIPANIHKLLVVPDGALGYLPFEMLVTSVSDKPAFLVEDFDIHYRYSAYLTDKQSGQSTDRLKYLGFAPSYASAETRSSANRAALGVLTHNKEEVLGASAFFPGRAFVDSAGTEQKFRQYAPSAGILHFSMHAMINDEQPELSRLVFYQDEDLQPSDTEVDGNLYLYELYNESLQAQLTVLSACNTGDGRLRRGEGISSLGRAFRYAGCNSIVVSMWEANDRHTQYLTNRFFHYLKEGAQKDEALKRAKLDFLSEPTHKYFRHPAYWASLVLIGEPSSLHRPNRLPLWISLGIAFIAIAGLVFYRNLSSRSESTG